MTCPFEDFSAGDFGQPLMLDDLDSCRFLLTADGLSESFMNFESPRSAGCMDSTAGPSILSIPHWSQLFGQFIKDNKVKQLGLKDIGNVRSFLTHIWSGASENASTCSRPLCVLGSHQKIRGASQVRSLLSRDLDGPTLLL